MSNFMIRIELTQEDDYDKLHTIMQESGFVKTIQSPEGKYSLPRSEYWMENTNASIEEIITKTTAASRKAAVSDTSPKVVVIEVKNVKWSGLEQNSFETLLARVPTHTIL